MRSLRLRFLFLIPTSGAAQYVDDLHVHQMVFFCVQIYKILIPTLGHNQKHETQRGYAHLKRKGLNVRPARGNNTIFYDFQTSFLVLRRGLRKSKLTYLRMNLHVLKFRR